MDDSLRLETNARDTEKCSACRQRKKKCTPHYRDWENRQQKCGFCKVNELPCGPNVRYSDDPAIIQRQSVVPEDGSLAGSNQIREWPREDLEGSIASPSPNIPAPTKRRKRQGNTDPPNARGIEEGRGSFGTTSRKDLEYKAKSKFHEFHALGNTLSYVSQPAFVYRHAHGERAYQDLSIEEKLHDLFIHIYEIAIEANDLNDCDQARWILFSLVNALDQYPRLIDHRKRHILLKIALMFQELGHGWDCERVLLKIAKMSTLPSSIEPFPMLAKSFLTSSMSIRRVVEDRWNETVRGNHVDSNLNVPPLHVAVQHGNPSVIDALLSNPHDCSTSHLPPSLDTSSDISQVRVNIEERDLSSRTALFAAVANGDESCCVALLCHRADANTRDDCGHTVLEVAVRGGNLSIVKNLIAFHAWVNPDIMGCSSLPLHAAIESGNFQRDIIDHLLESGAEVGRRRYVDNKNAIDLAVDRGYHELAESMRQMLPSSDLTPFMLRDPSVGQIGP